MKHFLCFFAAFIMVSPGVFSQAPSHTIEVGRFDDYNQGALTITDSHFIEYWLRDKSGNLVGSMKSFALTWAPADVEGNAYSPAILSPGAIIAEINGQKTDGITPEQFYSIVDASEIVTLGIENRFGKKIEQVSIEKRIPGQNPEVREWIPVNIDNYPGYHNWDIYPNAYDFIGGLFSVPKTQFRDIECSERGIHFEEHIDKNFDFGACSTYSVDLREWPFTTVYPDAFSMYRAGLVECSGDTDLRFSVHKDFYPGNPMICQLNVSAKNRNDDVVWEVKASSPIKNRPANYVPDQWDYWRLFKWICIPPFDRMVVIDRTYVKRCGLVQDEDNPSSILYVEPGSRADKAGFLPGDILLKADTETDYTKAYRSWGMKNAIGDNVDLKISVKSFPLGFFDDTNTCWIREDEHIGYLDIDGFLDNRHLLNWLSSNRTIATTRPTHGPEGQKPAMLDWTVTIKRGNKRLKLTLPSIRDDGYMNVKTYFMCDR